MVKEENVISFEQARLALASKEPPMTGNWLSRLPKNTRFLANRKAMNDSTLLDFLVASDPKQMPAVVLGYELSHRDGGFRWVDPVKFSRDYDFYMTVEIDGNGPEVQAGGMEGDGNDQVVDPVHEGK